MHSDRKSSKVFYGWYIIGAFSLIILYTSGVVHWGFTALFEPIAEEFGWSYAHISLAASLRGLEIGLLAPLMGLLVDRWGPRRLIFWGSILISLGLFLLSRVSSIATLYGACAVLAVGMSTCTSTVLMTAVANWFPKKPSVAIGIVSSGFGLGGLLIPLVTRLVDTLHWRTGMLVLSLGTLAVVTLLSLVVRDTPEHHSRHVEVSTRYTGDTNSSESSVTTEVNMSAKEALKNRAFWHLAGAGVCHMFALGGIVTHIMPFLSTLGIARSVSSLLALVLPIISIGGRLSSAWFCDKFGSRKVYIAGFALVTAGLLFFEFVTAERMWLFVAFAITFSLGWGYNVTTRVSMQREYLGRENFGTILGFANGIMMLGNVAGAPVAGWIFDIRHTYQWIWLGYSALTLVGAILVFTIPSPAVMLGNNANENQ